MTNYDLRTRKALRQVTLLEYGFGPDTLRRRKICPNCGRANSADRTDCADCGARLPEMTLYDLYPSRHRCCPKCGKYVSSAMFNVNAGLCLDCAPWEDEYPSFCHHCGARLRESDACFCPVCGAKLQVGGTDGREEAE